ncbi:12492_t:CDS:2 [Acaulospora morrowiae]|uniref:12492_t:CDS:1 n=1 Tax=Acaulospora morrowiae TaxID=94023 RepID=A0A9N9BVG7_9GLOM|nr:12492_t:CDS:2 [Acaulospora morrowiae]
MFGAGLQVVLRIPTDIWPLRPVSDVWNQSPGKYLSVRTQGLIPACCVPMFRSTVTKYLNDTEYSHWSIISILEYTKLNGKLYVDSINDLKADIYASYKEKLKEFIDKLREDQEERGFDTAFQINVAPVCTIKALKSYRTNQVLISELKDENKEGEPYSGMVLRKRKNRVNYAESLSEVETDLDYEEESKEAKKRLIVNTHSADDKINEIEYEQIDSAEFLHCDFNETYNTKQEL